MTNTMTVIHTDQDATYRTAASSATSTDAHAIHTGSVNSRRSGRRAACASSLSAGGGRTNVDTVANTNRSPLASVGASTVDVVARAMQSNGTGLRQPIASLH
jgi:hypothetical protein